MTDRCDTEDGGESTVTDAGSEVAAVSERITRLEAENEQLRKRLDELDQRLADDESQGADVVESTGVTHDSEPDSAEASDEYGGASSITRRSVMGVVAALGLGGAATGSVSAQTDHNHLNESWSGSTSSGNGLEVTETSTGKASAGIIGKTESPKDFSKGIVGIANATSGNTQALEGRNYSSSNNATGVVGHAYASSGVTYGLSGLNDSTEGTGLVGYATTDTGPTTGVLGKVDSPSGTALIGRHQAGSGTTYAVRGEVDSPDGYGLYTPDDAKVDGTVEVGGDLEVTGTKNFVQTVSTETGPREVTYTAVEAGTPRTEVSGVTEMQDGVAVVDLPSHFSMVTSDEEPVTVQVTPYADDQVHPQVTDRSLDSFTVEEFADGLDTYTFAYTVKGTRKGFEDRGVVSDADD